MRWIGFVIALLGLSACAPSFSEGPDEFGVVPTRPLEQPANYSDLPEPTPGSINRADVRPNADAAAALGGRPAGFSGVPASDAAVVTFASRFGVDPNIRGDLFEEDEAYRQRRGRFRILNFGAGERYFRIYAPQTLDAYQELERFRAAGVRVPTAPPRN